MVLTSRWKEFSVYWFRISWTIQNTLDFLTEMRQISFMVLVVDFHKYKLLSSKQFPLNSLLPISILGNSLKTASMHDRHAKNKLIYKIFQFLQEIINDMQPRSDSNNLVQPRLFAVAVNEQPQTTFQENLTNAFQFHIKIAISQAENQLILRVYGSQRSKCNFMLRNSPKIRTAINSQAAGCMSCINYINLWLTLLEFYSKIDSLSSHMLGSAQFLLWLMS